MAGESRAEFERDRLGETGDRLAVIAKAREHHGNCERFAAEALTPAMRDAWLVAVSYWQWEIEQLQRGDAMAKKQSIDVGQAMVFVREDGAARDALTTGIQGAESDATAPPVNCLTVTPDGVIEPHTSVPYCADAEPATACWRRTTDHQTKQEIAYETRPDASAR
jgi:hypothetical protein